MYDGFAAPYRGLPDDAVNGYRRFPLSIPFDNYDNGNGAAQTHHYETLLRWDKPVHFIWGCSDDIFPEEGGRRWANDMGATFDRIEDANHFLQNTHGPQIVDVMLRRIADDPVPA
jgi:pimeloyl-ACP methyl ester carboxylesterase